MAIYYFQLSLFFDFLKSLSFRTCLYFGATTSFNGFLSNKGYGDIFNPEIKCDINILLLLLYYRIISIINLMQQHKIPIWKNCKQNPIPNNIIYKQTVKINRNGTPHPMVLRDNFINQNGNGNENGRFDDIEIVFRNKLNRVKSNRSFRKTNVIDNISPIKMDKLDLRPVRYDKMVEEFRKNQKNKENIEENRVNLKNKKYLSSQVSIQISQTAIISKKPQIVAPFQLPEAEKTHRNIGHPPYGQIVNKPLTPHGQQTKTKRRAVYQADLQQKQKGNKYNKNSSMPKQMEMDIGNGGHGGANREMKIGRRLRNTAYLEE